MKSLTFVTFLQKQILFFSTTNNIFESTSTLKISFTDFQSTLTSIFGTAVGEDYCLQSRNGRFSRSCSSAPFFAC